MGDVVRSGRARRRGMWRRGGHRPPRRRWRDVRLGRGRLDLRRDRHVDRQRRRGRGIVVERSERDGDVVRGGAHGSHAGRVLARLQTGGELHVVHVRRGVRGRLRVGSAALCASPPRMASVPRRERLREHLRLPCGRRLRRVSFQLHPVSRRVLGRKLRPEPEWQLRLQVGVRRQHLRDELLPRGPRALRVQVQARRRRGRQLLRSRVGEGVRRRAELLRERVLR